MVKVIKLVSGRTSIGTQLYLVLKLQMDQIHRLTILTQHLCIVQMNFSD